LKKPLENRLNIVLSRNSEIEPQDSAIVLRNLASALSLNIYLRCDLFIMGGGQVYRSFLPYIEKWIVTEVPLTVEDADAFVPQNYLEGFKSAGKKQLDENLTVRFYERSTSSPHYST